MSVQHKISPQWVLVDQQLCHVSSFTHLSPEQRPNALCPTCQRPVILKLGTVYVHHYAHHPSDVCSASEPETALHLNTKYHIYQQLKQSQSVFIEDKCVKRCGANRFRTWLEQWDDVELEYSWDSYRPDIAILSNGQVVGAIEVVVTHPVDAQKADFYSRNGVTWLEILGDESIYEGNDSWTPAAPLPYNHCHPRIGAWVCPSCREYEQRQQQRREYERNNYEEIYCAKMVDFYFRSGKKYREVYYVMKKVSNGEWAKAWIKNEKNKVIATVHGAITKESLQALNQGLSQDIAKTERQGAIVDRFMEWRLWVQGQRFIARDIDRFPFRYFWDEQKRQWKKID